MTVGPSSQWCSLLLVTFLAPGDEQETRECPGMRMVISPAAPSADTKGWMHIARLLHKETETIQSKCLVVFILTLSSHSPPCQLS